MKQNIMVILCDQLRKDFLSCYGFGAIKTENIDALAENGLRFDCATTASPVCAPARASMMTGRWVSDHGVWTNDVPFREGVDYLPQRMNEAGYRTGAFGKLHHFPGKDGKGFSIFKLMEENRLKENDDYFAWLKAKHPEVENVFPHLENGDFAYSKKDYYEQWIADNSIDFISEKSEKPFFAWVSFQGPHNPMDPPSDVDVVVNEAEIPLSVNPEFFSGCEVPDYRGVANTTETTAEARANYRLRYTKMIAEIDRQVGRLIETLKQTGEFENTTIIFSADHGDMCGDYGMFQKGPMPYSAQFEVPMILSNCPNAPKGESTLLCSNLDIGATCLSLAGDEKPFGISRSLAKMANGETSPHKSVFAEFCDSIKILDTARYRFAYYPFAQQCQLFDKTEKDFEQKNHADEPEFASLKAKFLMEILDYTVIAKGAKIEAQDFVPAVQKGLSEKMPNFADELPLVFPLQSEAHRERLRNAGFNADYNEFCKAHTLRRHYGAYWLPKGEEKHED